MVVMVSQVQQVEQRGMLRGCHRWQRQVKAERSHSRRQRWKKQLQQQVRSLRLLVRQLQVQRGRRRGHQPCQRKQQSQVQGREWRSQLPLQLVMHRMQSLVSLKRQGLQERRSQRQLVEQKKVQHLRTQGLRSQKCHLKQQRHLGQR
jgi:hypothetical protein